MIESDGWVLCKDLDYLCRDCLQRCEDAEMCSCAYGKHEFPTAKRCLEYVPDSIAEGG